MLDETEPQPPIDVVLHIFEQIEEALEEIADEVTAADVVSARREEE